MFIMYKNGLGEMTGETLKGDFIILLSVFSIAIYLVLARRATRKHPAMNITFFMTVVACVLFNLLAVTKHVQQNSLSLYFAPFQNGEFLWSILYWVYLLAPDLFPDQHRAVGHPRIPCLYIQ